VIYHLLESLRIIAILISPFMPGTSEKILGQLGIADLSAQNLESAAQWGGLPAGNELKRGETLFPRIEYKKEEAPAAPTPKKKDMLPIKPEITYEEFDKIDLRVAEILEAAPVPGAKKLLKMKIDMGEQRQIVAGIAQYYKPEELVGKKIVVVCNLKPTKLMGVDSNGMLLATDTEGAGLSLIGFDRVPETGAKVR